MSALAPIPKGSTFASLEAERVLLGALLVDPTLISSVFLGAGDFAHAGHAAMFKAMRRLEERQAAIDTVTLVDELQRAGDLALAGGAAGIAALVDGLPRLTNVEAWEGIIREAAAKRRIHAAGERLTVLAASDGTAADALEEGSRILQETAQHVGSAVDLDVDGQMREALRALEESAKGDGEGWSTGLPTLDRAMGPLRRGQFMVVGGPTGGGKSTLVSNTGDSIASTGAAVLLFSLEMGVGEISKRRLLREAGVDASHFERGGITATPRDWERVAQAVGRLRERPFYVDASAPTPLEMRAKSRIVKGRRGLGVVIIDYLQLVNPGAGRKGENREQEVSRVSRALKRMAMDLDVLVIAAAQINRDASRDKRPPRLSDLRESGALEQDADIVLLLHRPDDERHDVVEVQVAKHRNRGRSRWLRLGFDGGTHRFHEAES